MPQRKAEIEIYEFLRQRRSAGSLREPAPHADELAKILRVAGTVPDHGQLRPYRFVAIEGEARERFALGLLESAQLHRGHVDESLSGKIKAKAYAAPMSLHIIFSPQDNPKIPKWEQMATAACSGYALLLAAQSLGYAGVWKSFAYPPGPLMNELLQLKKEEANLGWLLLGSDATEQGKNRTDWDFSTNFLHLQ